MKFTPSSTARFRTRFASSTSFGSPQMPLPVSRIAPNPRRFTSRSPPNLNVRAGVLMFLFWSLLFVVRGDLSEDNNLITWNDSASYRQSSKICFPSAVNRSLWVHFSGEKSGFNLSVSKGDLLTDALGLKFSCIHQAMNYPRNPNAFARLA